MSRASRFLWLLLLALPAVLPAQTPIGGDIVVSHARQFQLDPHVAVGARGDFVVSWLRETSRGFALYARRYTVSGAPASGEVLVAGSSVSTDGVAIARDGSFVVVFTYGKAGALSLGARWYAPNGAHIYVRRFSAEGLPLGPLAQANGYAAPEQFLPVVAAGPGGSFVVAWASGATQTTDILVRRFRR